MCEANLMRRLDKLLFLDSAIFGGMKVKVISGDSTDKLRFKIRK